MIKKVPIAKLTLLIDKTYSLLQLSNQLSSYGKQAKLLFIEQQTGAGFFQWTLPGDDWKPFSEFDDATKPVLAKLYEERRAMISTALNGFPLLDAVLSVPSENEFVYFRQQDGDWEIALTAWGYKFVNVPMGNEIGAWIEQKEYQEVNIGFNWNGALLPNMPFLLDEMPRTTSSDGFFHVSDPLEVGRSFVLKASDGMEFPLVVEKGKSEYVFDITHYLNVETNVTLDGNALANQKCDVSFNGTEYHLQTDEAGFASVKMPLACNRDGKPSLPQPDCIASCSSETQKKTPPVDGESLRFDFVFVTPAKEPDPVEQPDPVKEPEPIVTPEPEPKYVKIRLLDYGGYPLPDLPFKLTTKKMGEKELRTDDKGCCQVPQEWFSHKEKMRIKFIVSPEYQETHDIHLKKK